MFDVSTSGENPLQVDPPPLDINPNIKKSIDPVQPVLPGHGVVLKHLEVGRQLHGGHRVDVLFDFVEKVVPAADQTALVLVVDQVKFIGHPGLAHLGSDRIKRKNQMKVCMSYYFIMHVCI